MLELLVEESSISRPIFVYLLIPIFGFCTLFGEEYGWRFFAIAFGYKGLAVQTIILLLVSIPFLKSDVFRKNKGDNFEDSLN